MLDRSGATSIDEYEGVIADYTEAISLNSNTHVSYYQRGVLIADRGKAHEAFPDLEKGLQIAKWIGDEDYIDSIQRKLRELKQAVRQFHDRARRNSENE